METKQDKEEILPQYERSKSENCLKVEQNSMQCAAHNRLMDEVAPPIPPLPLNYQRSDGKTEKNFFNFIVVLFCFKRKLMLMFLQMKVARQMKIVIVENYVQYPRHQDKPN